MFLREELCTYEAMGAHSQMPNYVGQINAAEGKGKIESWKALGAGSDLIGP